MTLPPGWNLNVQLRNRTGSNTTWNFDLTAAKNDDGGFNNRLIGRFGFRPAPRWQLSVNPTIQRQVEAQQYIATLPGGTPATFGTRYVFGNVDRSTYSAQFRLGYTFKARPQPRPVCGAVCRQRPVLQHRRAAAAGHAPAARVLRRRDHGARRSGFPPAVTAQQRRAAMGVSSRQLPLRGVAAGPKRIRAGRTPDRRRRPVQVADGARHPLLRREDVVLGAGGVTNRG